MSDNNENFGAISRIGSLITADIFPFIRLREKPDPRGRDICRGRLIFPPSFPENREPDIHTAAEHKQ